MLGKRIFLALFFGVFLILGLLTLPDYGINWDTINHLPRGQAYLHYFLTGHKDFSDLPDYFTNWNDPTKSYWQKPNSLGIDTNIPGNKIPRVSLYQYAGVDYNYFILHDGDGHPPLSDILSSLFNTVLFQKLGIVNDIDSYHVYGILLAACLVGLVFWWVASEYGLIAGVIAALVLATYPLFWSESHFNTEKDIPETVFWSFMIYGIWRGVVTKSIKWILISGVFWGLALGTKLNIIFSVFVFGPWLIIYLFNQWFADKKNLAIFVKNYLPIFIAGILAVVIGCLIFFITWPYLWPDPVKGVKTFLSFYKTIGLTTNVDPRFVGPFDLNKYPLKWILYTTPLISLLLCGVGTLVIIKNLVSKKALAKVEFLFLLWLVVPIGRIVWPGTNVYGGVRQIMEYIPALAIVAGIGGAAVIGLITTHLNKTKLSQKLKYGLIAALIIVSFVPITLKLIEIHPNENVYFNSLVGGLPGAKEKDLPSWGNTFGEAYRQGVNWLDQNAEYGSHIVFAYELIPNIPRILLRSDFILHNSFRSGYLRQGEYAITLVYQGTENRSYYDEYLNTFLEPVYQAKVDGVPILEVWKNDNAHLKVHYQEELVQHPQIIPSTDGLVFDLGEVSKLSRLEANYTSDNCVALQSGLAEISTNNQDWTRLPGTLPDDWTISILGEQPKNGHFIEPFVGQSARYIKIVLAPETTCLKKNLTNYQIFVFK